MGVGVAPTTAAAGSGGCFYATMPDTPPPEPAAAVVGATPTPTPGPPRQPYSSPPERYSIDVFLHEYANCYSKSDAYGRYKVTIQEEQYVLDNLPASVHILNQHYDEDLCKELWDWVQIPGRESWMFHFMRQYTPSEESEEETENGG